MMKKKFLNMRCAAEYCDNFGLPYTAIESFKRKGNKRNVYVNVDPRAVHPNYKGAILGQKERKTGFIGTRNQEKVLARY